MKGILVILGHIVEMWVIDMEFRWIRSKGKLSSNDLARVEAMKARVEAMGSDVNERVRQCP